MNTDKSSKRTAVELSASIALLMLVIMLCAFRSSCTAIGCTAAGDPGAVVTSFLDAMKSGSYDVCDSHLDNYSSLGMNSSTDSDVGQKLHDMLLESYSYSLLGRSEISGITASQRIRVTYLDIDSLAQPLHDSATEIANDYAYTGIDIYNEQTAEKALDEAVAKISENIASYYRTDDITVSLKYDGSSWKIVLDDELFSVVVGNLK